MSRTFGTKLTRILIAAVLAVESIFALTSASPASAAPVSSVQTVRAQAAKVTPKRYLAMRWAKTQAGKAYCSPGGNSGRSIRSCYDCSGLVGTAYRRQGFSYMSGGTSNFLSLPSSKLVRTSNPHWGDLAFYGSGHVELFGHWSNGRARVTTFGAHNHRMSIGYRTVSMGSSYHPTAFYHVVNAG